MHLVLQTCLACEARGVHPQFQHRRQLLRPSRSAPRQDLRPIHAPLTDVKKCVRFKRRCHRLLTYPLGWHGS